VAVGGLMLLVGRFLVGLFISSEDPAIAEQAVSVAFEYLAVMAIPLFVLYLLYVYRAALQGSGDTVTPFLSAVMETVLRVAVVHTLPALLGQRGIFLAEPLAWLSADIILLPAYFLRMNRLRKRSALT
jgi:Na+-driven multidrug efflux pump